MPIVHPGFRSTHCSPCWAGFRIEGPPGLPFGALFTVLSRFPYLGTPLKPHQVPYGMDPKPELFSVDGIGAVQFVRKRTVRRLSIRLRPFEPVRILAPASVSRGEALRFLEEKQEWVLRHRLKLRQLEASRTLFAEDVPFRTRTHELSFRRASVEAPRARISAGTISVLLPHDEDLASEETQHVVRKVVERAYHIEATAYLPGRLSQLAARHGFKFGRVTIRNQQSRWGSCSSRNNINLNLHLIRLPDPLIDYVLLHELAHTVEKNHGPGFWKLLNQHTGGRARALDRELKQYSINAF